MMCACGSGQEYSVCCEPFILGNAFPETAEKLMRSRYTAHTVGAIDYIKNTMAADARKDFDPEATKDWCANSVWKGLKIVSTEAGGPDDSKGTVEFVATYERNGRGIEHHEVSQFTKSMVGRWLFVDGEAHEHKEGEGHHHHPAPVTVKRESPKIGRNDPCSCGSGKKFKKCCAA